MSLVSLTEAFQRAGKTSAAVGAFNVNSWEMIPAIVAAAEERNMPVVLQVQSPFLEYAGVVRLARFMLDAALFAAVPVVLQLDHARTWEQVMACLRAGFSSVMIDASHLPFAENIRLTAEVARVAHAMGVSVESELGKVAGKEGDVAVSEIEATFTDPEEAAVFVAATGIDALAVAIGTVHGPYRGEPMLDFTRLAAIRERAEIPLVLHGASGVPDAALQKAVTLGVRKVNFSTELRETWLAAMREASAMPDAEPLPCIKKAQSAVREVVSAKIGLLACN